MEILIFYSMHYPQFLNNLTHSNLFTVTPLDLIESVEIYIRCTRQNLLTLNSTEEFLSSILFAEMTRANVFGILCLSYLFNSIVCNSMYIIFKTCISYRKKDVRFNICM